MKKIVAIALIVLFSFSFVGISQAFECPKNIEQAQKLIKDAEEAVPTASPGVKEQVDKALADAKESLKKGEDLHHNAQGLQDHASSVRALYESMGAAKEAFYLATKVK